ncbi:MAG: helix-turn-helix transcriptional regulator [Acidobacteriota bacterium]
MAGERPKGVIDIQDVLQYLERDAWLDKRGACDYLKVKERTLQEYMHEGLPYYRLSPKLLRFKRSELDRWMTQFRCQAGGTRRIVEDVVSQFKKRRVRQ